MDKKLLVSLMMVAPVAAFAQSGLTVTLGSETMDVNIPATIGNWLPDNVGNSDDLVPKTDENGNPVKDEDGNVIMVPSQQNVYVANGLVMSTLSNSTLTLAFASANFAPGQYVINFGKVATNLNNVDIQLNGTTIYTQKDGVKANTGASLNAAKELVYDSTKDPALKDAEGVMSKLTVVAKKVNKADFGIGAINMSLNYNMKLAAQEVVDAYDAANWSLVYVDQSKDSQDNFTCANYAEVLRPTAKALAAKYEALSKDLDLNGTANPATFGEKITILKNALAVQALLDPSEDEDAEASEDVELTEAQQDALNLLWNAYVSYGFSSYVPGSDAKVLPLVTTEEATVKAYNEQANALNAQQDNFTVNTAALAYFKDSVYYLRQNYASSANTAEKYPGNLEQIVNSAFDGKPLEEVKPGQPGYQDYLKEKAERDALAQFCQFAVSEGLTSIGKAIDAWDATISSVFAEDNLTKYIVKNNPDGWNWSERNKYVPNVNPATGEPDVQFVNEYATLDAEASNLGQGYTGAKNDWLAFQKFQKAAQIVYDFYLTDWAGVSEKLYTGYDTNYTNLCYQYQKKLQKIYDDNHGYLIEPGVDAAGNTYAWANALQPDNAAIIGASGKYYGNYAPNDDEPTVQDFKDYVPNDSDPITALNQAKKKVYEMGGLPEQLKKQVERNEANHAVADKEISGLETQEAAFNNVVNGSLINGIYNDEDTSEEMVKAITDAKNAYSELAAAISALDDLYDQQYNDYILVDPSTDPVVNAGDDQKEAKAAEAVEKAQDAVDAALAKYNKAVDAIGLGDTFDLLNDLEEKYAEVKIATSAKDIAGYNLADLFEPSYKDIYASIEALSKKPNDASLTSQIEDAIKNFGGSACTDLVDAFSYAAAQLAAINSELDAFDKAALPKNKWYYGTTMDEQLEAFKFTYPGWKESGKDVKLSREEMGTRVANLKTQLENAASGTPQNATKAAQNFYNGIHASDSQTTVDGSVVTTYTNDWTTRIAYGEVAYAEQVTTVNQKNAFTYCYGIWQNLDEAVKAQAPGLPAGFSATVDAASLELNNPGDYSTVGQIGTYLENNTLSSVAAYKTVDSDIKKFVDAYTAKYNSVKKAADNYKAYSDLNKALAGIGLDKYIDDVNAATVEPAAKYFRDLKPGFQKEYDAIVADVNDSYEDMTEVADKADYLSQINALKTKVADTLKQCAANDAAYQALALQNADIVALANSVTAYIEANDMLPEHKAAQLAEIKKITDEAATTDNAVRNDFAKGICGTNQATYKTKYADLLQQLKDIDAQFEGAYRLAVIDANNTYLDDNNIGGLAGRYQDIVNWVNDYRDAYGDAPTVYYQMLLDNDQYRAYHYELQEQYTKIMGAQGYDARLNNFKNSLTAGENSEDWVILSQIAPVDEATGELLPASNNLTAAQLTDYNQLAALMSEGSKINEVMTNAYAGINTIGTQTAVTYMQEYAYADPDGAVTKMNDVRTILEEDYGFLPDSDPKYNEETEEYDKQYDGEASQRYLDEFMAIDAADADYNSLMMGVNGTVDNTEARREAEHELITGMKPISETVDDIYGNGKTTDQMVKDAVLAQWQEVYTTSLANIDKWIATLEENVIEGDVLSEAYADVLDLQDIKAEIEKRGISWNALKPADRTVPDNFKELYNAGIYDPENGIEDPISELGLRQLSEKAQDIYGGFTNTQLNNQIFAQLVEDTKSPAQEVQNLIKALIADYGVGATIEGYQNDLDNIVNNVTLDKLAGNLDEDQLSPAGKGEPKTFFDNFNDLKEKIKKDGAKKAFADAQAYVANNLVNLAKSALNTAKVENKVTDAEFKTISDKINQLQADALALTFDPSKSAADIQAAKKGLVDLIVELDDKGGKYDSAADAVAVLDVRASKISDQLEALKNQINAAAAETGVYGEAVANEFNTKVEDLETELKEITDNYNGAGDAVIGQVDDYTYQLNRIAYEINHSYKGTSIGLEASWMAANDKATRYYNSDVVADALLYSLDNMENMVNFAHDAILEYQKNAKGEGYDDNQSVYAALIKKIGGADGNGGYRATVNFNKDRHSYVKGDDKNYYYDLLGSDIRAYVKPTLTKAFGLACDDADAKIDYLIAVVLGQKPESKNEDGWTYSYPDEAALIATLLDQHKKVAALEDQKGLINQAPNANGVLVNNTAGVAIEQYKSLIEKLNAINAETQDIYDEAKADSFILGDVALNDGKITVVDVQTLINWVGTNKSLSDNEKKLADVTGDGVINIGDVTALINIMMEQGMPNKPDDPNAPDPTKVRSFIGGSNSVAVEEIEGENGMRRFAVALFNETAFAAGQIDINLPAGASIAAITLGERAEGLESFVFDNNGYTRVILTSLDNTLIEGNTGSILYIDVEGNAEISIDNVIFSDANGKTYDLSNNGSGVNGIYDSLKNGIKAIYNAAGQKLNNLTKGINIIRNADGTTTKKVGK